MRLDSSVRCVHPVGSCAISIAERPYRLDETVAEADRKGND
jgi:hypothetical protein